MKRKAVVRSNRVMAAADLNGHLLNKITNAQFLTPLKPAFKYFSPECELAG